MTKIKNKKIIFFLSGRFKFVFPLSSGRVVAERAVKVLQKDPAEKDRYQVGVLFKNRLKNRFLAS